METRNEAAPGGRAVYRGRRAGLGARARRALVGIAGGAVLVGALATCVSTPITGRRAFNLYSVDQEVPLGAAAYDEILAGETIVTSGAEHQMVQRVTQRLIAAAAPEDPGYEWESRLVRAPDIANAFCLPGGKMAVYTGILPITQNEAALAAVMGHEIGHALARHGTERLSQAEVLGTVAEVAGNTVEGAAQYAQLAGPVLELALRPWGRKQELEADHMGLVLMARAGYDPREAIGLWERMEAASGGSPSGAFAWFSTHPTGQARIDQIRSLLPEVMPIYEANRAR